MTCVNEIKLLRQLKRWSTAALSEIIELYTPYVYAIASNVMRPMLPAEDVEEAVSDCFAALWYNRDSVEPGKLKGYLAVVVRNKALSALRSKHIESVLEDDIIDLASDSPEEGVLTLELRERSGGHARRTGLRDIQAALFPVSEDRGHRRRAWHERRYRAHKACARAAET